MFMFLCLLLLCRLTTTKKNISNNLCILIVHRTHTIEVSWNSPNWLDHLTNARKSEILSPIRTIARMQCHFDRSESSASRESAIRGHPSTRTPLAGRSLAGCLSLAGCSLTGSLSLASWSVVVCSLAGWRIYPISCKLAPYAHTL